jgi:hypothetical protein
MRALRVPITKDGVKQLKGKALYEMQIRWANIVLLIIDEMSMIGDKVMTAMEKRLRHCFSARSHLSFGGLFVVQNSSFKAIESTSGFSYRR